MTLFRKFRPLVERKLPFFAIIFREFREQLQFILSSPKLTTQGFRMVGRADMVNGEFEKEFSPVFLEQFKNADLFVDVGANIGYYSCWARSLGKNIISIEPLSRNLKYLMKNFELNNWVDEKAEIWKAAVGEKFGLVRIFGGDTGASLLPGWADNSVLQNEIVTTMTLDNILNERFLNKKIFMKIDVEGFEFEALKGARKILNQSLKPTLLIEISYSANYPNGKNPNYMATFDLLFNLGYNVYPVLNIGVRQIPVSKIELNSWISESSRTINIFNFLCVP